MARITPGSISNRRRRLSAYNALLDIEPDNYPALNNLGLVYARLKNPQKSNEYYHRAIAADSSSATAWFNLVQGFVASGQSDSATALLRQASNKFPDYSGTPWIAAELAVSQGRYDTARVIYTGLRTSPEISPEEKGAATANLAQVKLLEGRLREAKELISENSRGAAQAGALNYALASSLRSSASPDGSKGIAQARSGFWIPRSAAIPTPSSIRWIVPTSTWHTSRQWSADPTVPAPPSASTSSCRSRSGDEARRTIRASWE